MINKQNEYQTITQNFEKQNFELKTTVDRVLLPETKGYLYVQMSNENSQFEDYIAINHTNDNGETQTLACVQYNEENGGLDIYVYDCINDEQVLEYNIESEYITISKKDQLKSIQSEIEQMSKSELIKLLDNYNNFIIDPNNKVKLSLHDFYKNQFKY